MTLVKAFIGVVPVLPHAMQLVIVIAAFPATTLLLPLVALLPANVQLSTVIGKPL